MTEKIQYIPARLKNAAKGGHVAGAEDIIDDEKGKTLNVINEETNQRLATLEEAVGTGGSVDERINTEKERAEAAEGAINETIGTDDTPNTVKGRIKELEEAESITYGDQNTGVTPNGSDFTNPDSTKRAKVPTIGAIIDGADDEPTVGSQNLVKSGGIKSYVDKLDKIIQCYVYYSQGYKPIFSLNNDRSVDIVFPDKNMYIYSRNGYNILGAILSLNNKTINIPTGNSLVLNMTDKSYSVITVGQETESDSILLFSNEYLNRFDGLLVPYYYQAKLKYYNDSIDTYIYWKNSGVPIFSISGTTVTITFPNEKFHIFRKGDGRVLSESSTGKGETFIIPTAKMLIYNPSTNTIDTANLDDIYPQGCYLLFTNNTGKFFTGMLTPYYYGKKTFNAGLSAYFIAGAYPDFAISDTNTLTVKFPNYNLRIYSVDRGVDYNISAYKDTSFILTTTQKLVFDIIDSTIKVVNGDAIGNYYNLLSNENLMVTGLLAPYYTMYQNSIPKLYDTQEEKLILWNMQRRSASGASEVGFYPLILLHFSDIHENAVNMQRIMDYKNMFGTQLNDVLNTGDTINEFSDSLDYYTSISGTENILITIGNHDVTSGQAGLPIYNKEISPFVANWGVTQPTDADVLGLCYYYKDYPNSNIRLIVLDNFATDINAQATWLSSVLADAKTNGFCVVCAAHFPCPMQFIKTTPFCSLDGYNIVDSTQAALISVVEQFISDGGNFACWLTGHTHANLVGTVTGYPNQLCVTVASASYSRNYGSMARINKTKSQDCFNIVSIDENTKCIKLHRVGADIDRYMRKVDCLCYNYDTHTIIA